jgi:hypothetical protein
MLPSYDYTLFVHRSKDTPNRGAAHRENYLPRYRLLNDSPSGASPISGQPNLAELASREHADIWHV